METILDAIAQVSQAWNELLVSTARQVAVDGGMDAAKVKHPDCAAIVNMLQPGDRLEPLADALGKLFTARDES